MRARLKAAISVEVSAEAREKAVERVAAAAGLKVVVDWPSLAAQNIKPDAPVSTSLKDVPAGRVLRVLLEMGGHGSLRVPIVPDKAVVRVAGAQRLATTPQAYPVADLIRAGGRDGLTEEQQLEDLTRVLMESVAPDTWIEAGGTVGSVKMVKGAWLIETTPDIQDEVAGLLGALRAATGGRRVSPEPSAARERARKGVAQPIPPPPAGSDLAASFEHIRAQSKLQMVADPSGIVSGAVWQEVSDAKGGPIPVEKILEFALPASHRAKEDGNGYEIDPDGIVHVGVLGGSRGRFSETRCYNVLPLVAGNAAGANPAERVKELTSRVVKQVEPDSWRVGGGSVGTILSYGPVLVITHLPSTHDKVMAMLQNQPGAK